MRDRLSNLKELTIWALRNCQGLEPEEVKRQVRAYAKARFGASDRTAKDYAESVVLHLFSNLPEQARLDIELSKGYDKPTLSLAIKEEHEVANKVEEYLIHTRKRRGIDIYGNPIEIPKEVDEVRHGDVRFEEEVD